MVGRDTTRIDPTHVPTPSTQIAGDAVDPLHIKATKVCRRADQRDRSAREQSIAQQGGKVVAAARDAEPYDPVTLTEGRQHAMADDARGEKRSAHPPSK
jgi:hypothetical protein